MKNIKKGQFGYRRAYKIQAFTIIILFILAILFQLFLSKFYATKSFSKVFIVMAILTVLPMANIASPFLASIKYNTPSFDEYRRVSIFENKVFLIYDLILTMREQIMPIDYLALSKDNIYLYLSEKKVSKELTLNFLYENLKIYKKSNIHIFYDIEKFINRLDQVEADKNDKLNSYNNIRDILLSISI